MKASDLRPGMVVIMDGDLYRVVEAIHKTPGNLRAFIQAKMMRLKDGIQKENRFASTDEIEKATLESRPMQYLYKDGQGYHFMDTENYEQIAMAEEQLGNSSHYLMSNIVVEVTCLEGRAIGIVLPQSMEFKVTEAEPGMRTATASASYKTVTIESGHQIKVPQFINAGDTIRVNTTTNEYLERVKK